MRRAAVAVALALALVPAASAVESTIYPGVGIGKVKLGMTRTQVQRVLGGDAIVNDRDTVDGHAFLELGWNFASWSVGFLLQNGRYRAVRVGTTERAQHTLGHVGPGTHWSQVVKAYPHGRCTFLFNPIAGPEGPEYLVPHKGGTQTLFAFRFWPRQNDPTSPTYEVMEVVVRSAYESLPEFAPGWRYGCVPGWETASKPRPTR
ncbi:MAG: hypothetical protein ACJ744_13335 [Gaiellaceae bacterium]|jgi:hypothetical protein